MTALDHLAAALADRYTLERVVGAGGMATVYLARDLKHDRNVEGFKGSESWGSRGQSR